MAKLSLNRLRDKYPEAVTGDSYRALMDEILANNHENVSRAVARLHTDHFEKQAAKIKRSTTKQIAVPGLEEVLPKRSVFIRKGAEQGQMITDTLRDALTKNLRTSVAEYLKEGKGSMQYRRGEARGQIRPELVGKLKESLSKTFEDYTKAGPSGIPANIETIAQTEIRSAISDIKNTYAQKLQDRNPGRIQLVKIWRHHPSMSDKPRPGHKAIDGKELPLDAMFFVPRLIKDHNGWHWGEATRMAHPHDPTAPPDQIISCHCDCDYVTRVL